MFERGDMGRRNQSADVFNIESGFGRDAVFCQEIIERGPQELAVDEELERNGLFGREKTVNKSRQLVSAQFYRVLV